MINYLKLIKQLLIISGLAVVSISSSAAINLTAYPVTQTIVEGGIASIDIRIDGLGIGNAPSVSTYDIDIAFNPSVLSFSSTIFGDRVLGDQLDLLSLGKVSSVTPSLGTVNLFELSLDTPMDLNNLQADSFVLMTLYFSGLSVGMSPIDITLNALGDAEGEFLLANISSGFVTVTAVPEPETYAMLLAGLGLLGFMARRRKVSAV